MSMDHRERWSAWKAALERVTSNKHYRYDDPQKWTYLKLMRFAMSMMAVHNTAHWKGQA